MPRLPLAEEGLRTEHGLDGPTDIEVLLAQAGCQGVGGGVAALAHEPLANPPGEAPGCSGVLQQHRHQVVPLEAPVWPRMVLAPSSWSPAQSRNTPWPSFHPVGGEQPP